MIKLVSPPFLDSILEQKLFQRGNLGWKLNAQHYAQMWGIPQNMINLTATGVWPLPPSAESFYGPLTVKEGLLSFLHSSAVVSVMSLLGSGALLQATIRHCLIYTHYFLVVSSGIWRKKKQLLLHGISNLEANLLWWQRLAFSQNLKILFYTLTVKTVKWNFIVQCWNNLSVQW